MTACFTKPKLICSDVIFRTQWHRMEWRSIMCIIIYSIIVYNVYMYVCVCVCVICRCNGSVEQVCLTYWGVPAVIITLRGERQYQWERRNCVCVCVYVLFTAACTGGINIMEQVNIIIKSSTTSTSLSFSSSLSALLLSVTGLSSYLFFWTVMV